MPVSKKTLTLKHGEYDQVKFTDRNNHVFFMKMGKAFEACRRSRELEADLEGDEEQLVAIIEKWLQKNRRLFAGVAIAPTAGGLQLTFSSATEEFDGKLSDALAELESTAISELNAMTLETRQVSARMLKELQKHEHSKRVTHAKHPATHRAVEA